MATQKPGVRRIGSATWSGAVGRMSAPFRRPSRRRRQEELTQDLLRQLAGVAEEIRHANLIQLQRLIVGQVDRAMADPALMAAMSTLDDLPDFRRRQLLFVNREYATILLAYRIGSVDWGELLGHLRVLCRNSVFADYWERTAEHRRSLPVESVEAKVGEAVDVIMEELAEGPDEWWVVGVSPEG
jgi:hypothetical protein